MTGSADDATRSSGTPSARAVELKRRALASAGFPPELADRLAHDAAVDLREALGLVRAGFPPEVAAGMLRAGHRPVF